MTRVTDCGRAYQFFDMTAQASGVSVMCDAHTLLGAKREASAWMSYGGGSVVLHDRQTDERWIRRFWSTVNGKFGWGKWETVDA